MSTPWHQATLTSFDRQSQWQARLHAPERYQQIEQLPDDCQRIARGSGVSYVAASFDREAVSQSMAGFDRLLNFDNERGVLFVEAGASIAAVQRFALARGWYLPVAPGHPLASVGGCIAANVHGKNPARDGCFAAITGALRLFHPRLGWRDAEPNDALWCATLGGFGLTGSIVSAHVHLRPAAQRVRLEAQPVGNLHEAAELLREHADATLVYGWHDGRPAHFGRGLIRVGHASSQTGPGIMPRGRLPAHYRATPLPLWNRVSLALANEVLARRWAAAREIAMGEALSPLNDASGYFAAYGRRGLLECQWLIPHEAFEVFARKLTDLVHRQRPLLPLISFARVLAEVAIEHQGRPNPIKQSGLDAATLCRALPGLEVWKERVAAHNPGHLLQSELIRRLELDPV